ALGAAVPRLCGAEARGVDVPLERGVLARGAVVPARGDCVLGAGTTRSRAGRGFQVPLLLRADSAEPERGVLLGLAAAPRVVTGRAPVAVGVTSRRGVLARGVSPRATRPLPPLGSGTTRLPLASSRGPTRRPPV